jgi:hypothetical protein
MANDLERQAPEAEDVGPPGVTGEVVGEREAARRRLAAKRDFTSHLVAYLVVNGFLVAIWAFTGAGYFWPVWVIGGWGIGLAMHAWETFWHHPITEADVDTELRRHGG